MASTVLLLTPGAFVSVTNASITGVRLASPGTVPLRLLATTVPTTATLSLSNVQLETDCTTLGLYQQWFRVIRPVNVSLDSKGDLVVGSWQQPGYLMVECRVTCRRPPASTEPTSSQAPGGAALVVTTVDIFTDLDLYNALSLASYYDPGDVVLAIRCNINLTSPLWAAQGVIVARNVSLVGAVSGSGGSSDGSRAAARPVIDLQDIVQVVHLNDGVVLKAIEVAFANVGMVFGYAPVAFTGLGLVPMFMWFFDFQRSMRPKAPNQLQLYDCNIVSYPEDIEHINLWAIFLMSNVGPLAAAAAPFRIGVTDLLANTTSPILTFSVLEAYGMRYVNVALPPPSVAGVSLTARHSPEALYKLGLPVNTTVVPIWTQSDLQGSLAGTQRLSACSPFSNTTVFFQLFANMSLDGTKWPSGGYNVSCNIVIGGIPNRIGSTWLNFNLLSKFITLSNKAVLTVRSLTLFNMPSQLRTYDLGDLAQMTIPLWPISRPAGQPQQLALHDCTIVLPLEEHRSFEATLGIIDGRLFSAALNASILGVEFVTAGTHRVALAQFEGLNMTASNTLVIDTAGYSPFSPLLGNNIYGKAALTSSSPPPADGKGGAPLPGAGGGGASSSTGMIIAVAVAVPLGVAVLAVVIVAYMVVRRHSRSAREATYKWQAAAVSGGGGGAGGSGNRSAGNTEKGTEAASGGTSPLSDQSGETVGANVANSTAQPSLHAKVSNCDSMLAESAPAVTPLHVELHQLIMDFGREIEDKHLTIHDALGSGGFATVYRGTWRGIDVAVKVIEFQDRIAGDEKLRVRAMTEAAIAANIQHANIVTTYSYDIRPVVPHESEGEPASSSTLLGLGPAVGPGAPPPGAVGVNGSRRPSASSDKSGAANRVWKLYLIQEFCEVGSLRIALENRMLQTADGQPNMFLILRLLLDVVRGLQHLHKKNIVHGDLTPGNILLKADLQRPGRYVGKLADFGLSVKMNPSQTSVDNNRTGTPFYASPEVRQHGNLTKASDLYALGVVMWEMWHGRPCYQRVRGVKHYVHAAGYPGFPPHCSPTYADLAARCMRRALEERPGLDEVHELLRQLRDACGGGNGSASNSVAASEAGSTSCADEWPFMMPLMADGTPYAVGVQGTGTSAAGGPGASGSSARSVPHGAMAAAAAQHSPVAPCHSPLGAKQQQHQAAMVAVAAAVAARLPDNDAVQAAAAAAEEAAQRVAPQQGQQPQLQAAVGAAALPPPEVVPQIAPSQVSLAKGEPFYTPPGSLG
ncbi:hypothetical protein GPECTOR_18g107 [Gonium pectorale]|uniref:Protein kinase domain-containing protein n=1 Tax=Gonium pectorale TaxID=33097 RepID=A0A150GJG0_GONPE|nr:hypothetical protein GPECTOR_18g107 [Gonium pectorale]|eukprot:KXZ49949.1 hypothetical protein GPECTOR_18g107 [Gonium pectorale]